ncbi:MAG: HD domain-containing protein [Bacteroides sp.]|nr:HD domain-containing protein [Bacteroides sp.]
MNKKHLVMLLFSMAFSLVLSLTVSAEGSALENRIIYIFDDSNGLPTGEANTVIQTAEGYVWIGSYGGLIRYDGTTFHNYSENGVFPSSSIRALFQDSGGRLWIGTNDQGVFYYENDSFVQLTYEDNASFLSIRSFAEGKNGEVYVGATSGLAKAEGGALVRASDTIASTVYNIAVDSNGVVWACIDDGMAELIKDGETIGSFDSSKYLKASMYCLGGTESGDVLLGTSENYLYRVKLLDENYTDSSFDFAEYTTGDISTANWVTEDPKGNLWAAAQNGLGYADASGEWHTINSEHTASSRTVCFDYEGNVWAASSSYGVIHIVDSLYSNPNAAADISDIFINTIAIDNSGSYYLGTDSGVIMLNSDFRPVTNELTELLNGDRIRNISCDSKGNIWIGAYYTNGLIMYEPSSGKITQYTEENGLSSSQIRLITELSDGSVAVATQNGVSVIENGEVTKTYTKENGLDYPIILSLCEGSDGTLYAGSDGQGIYAVKDGSVAHYGFDEGLPAGVVLRMLLDEEGKGLFISAGNSLYYWDFESFRLLDNYIKSPGSIFDLRLQDGELWLMQSNGIHILDREKLLSGEDTKVRILGNAYGLTGTLNANTWNTEKDGILYLCTSEGISVLDLEQMSEGETAIRGAINQVSVDDTVYSSPESVSIDSGATRLTFNFAPLSFSGKTVTVRYRLKGFDEGVTVLTNNEPMSASYTNLSGGDYEFCIEVLGSDGETVVSSLTVPVHKDYRLVELTWFWVIAAALALALIIWCAVVIIHIKTAHLKKRQNEYRRIIGEALRTFANAIDAKDKYTNGHSLRVATYSLEIAKKLNFSEDDQERIYNIALLHDIGKIGISDRILNKPGKLTPEEIETVKRHPLIGGEILKDFASIPGISEGARYHHERYDGTGYNEGLKGEEIPYFARIICVADSYDTMSGGRHYQESRDSNWVKEELLRCSGTQFDPAIVKIMIELIDEGKAPVSFEDTKIRMFYEE